MRKVFLSNMLLQPMRETNYVSDDFALVAEKFAFPLSYVVAGNVRSGDTVVVVTAVERSSVAGATDTSVVNYGLYQQEVAAICAKCGAKVEFQEITISKEFDTLTFSTFFRQVAGKIQDDDEVYADITFGMKPYSLSMFMALGYALRAGRNVDLKQIIYAMRYSGTQAPEKVNSSVIYDLTGLFYLNALANRLQEGQKTQADALLDFFLEKE